MRNFSFFFFLFFFSQLKDSRYIRRLHEIFRIETLTSLYLHPIYLSIYLFIYLSILVCLHLSIACCFHLSTGRYVIKQRIQLPTNYLSIYLPISVNSYLSIYLSISLISFIYLSQLFLPSFLFFFLSFFLSCFLSFYKTSLGKA